VQDFELDNNVILNI